MDEKSGVTHFAGSPVVLLGPALKTGDAAPPFRVVDTALAPVTLADFGGKTKIICAVPSLDIPACDAVIRRFELEAARLSDDIVVLAISLDLSFAQKRWCAGAGIDRLKTLSDYQTRSFALAYGVLVKELQLLSCSVFVLDGNNTIRHVEHLQEMTSAPDYAATLQAAKEEIVVKQVPMDGICGGY